MKVSDMFPSKYVKGADLSGPVTLTIKTVRPETLQGNKKKYVAYFEKAVKGLILNKTNAYKIAEIVGDPDSDNWAGHRVTLYPTTVTAFNEQHRVIRIRKPDNGTPPGDSPDDLVILDDDDVPGDGSGFDDDLPW